MRGPASLATPLIMHNFNIKECVIVKPPHSCNVGSNMLNTETVVEPGCKHFVFLNQAVNVFFGSKVSILTW